MSDSAFDFVCDECKVYVDSESEYAKDFMLLHGRCHTDRAHMSRIKYHQHPHYMTSPRTVADSYSDLDRMTRVGRALVMERIVDRLKKQVKFVGPLLPDNRVNALAERLGLEHPVLFAGNARKEGTPRGITTRMLLDALVCMENGEQVYVQGCNDTHTIELWRDLKGMAVKLGLDEKLASPCPRNREGLDTKLFTDHYKGP